MNTWQTRILSGNPLPGDNRLLVSVPCQTADGRPCVIVSGNRRALYMARLALTRVEHDWLAGYGLSIGTVYLTSEEGVAAAKRWFERFVYEPENDPENVIVKGFVLSPYKDWRYWNTERTPGTGEEG